MLDFQSWLEYLATEDHQFIVAMDANAVYDPDGTATQHTLEYMNASLTVSPQHDGNFSTLVTTCNLCLPLAHQHTIRPFPASHISGRKQIEYIFVSKTILPAVLRSGVLSHHSLTKGDHRPYYLDFDASILFSDPAYNIEPASVRRLRLQDPCIVQQYTQKLHEFLASQNVLPRLDALQDKFNHQQWSPDCVAEYESLDRTITESMLTAKKSLSKRITTTYQWPPPVEEGGTTSAVLASASTPSP